ncbi:hypothetical protein [Microbispora sp. H10670]|uniref:hypothetical protein n=1 Tax=Microbispora sp. H10670 TaxID=2729108 RepID=UPI001600A08B|nr:hypothetical protein [Microbispora sp. H10670]
MTKVKKVPLHLRRAAELRRAKSDDKGFRRTIVFPTMVSLVSALLGALIGGGITAYTSQQAIEAQQAQQLQQLEEQHSDSIRATRIKVYQRFLAAADKMLTLGQSFSSCVIKKHDTYLRGNTGALDKLHHCKKAFKTYITSMPPSATDNLAIYGSKDALNRAFSLIAGVQFFVDDMATNGMVTVDKAQLLEASRAGFAQVMCKDLNPVPRADCLAQPSYNWPLPS